MASPRSFLPALRGFLLFSGLFAGAISACSSGASPATVAPSSGDAAVDDADAADAADAADDGIGPIGTCAKAFGNALTPGFGRIDGIVFAVQKPSDTECTSPNRDHVILQVLMNGAVYRLVINVQSDRAGADPKIRVGTLPHALPAPAFAEGWHRDAPLDYVTSLGAHSTDAAFSALDLQAATDAIASALEIGAPVAVYATSGAGRPESAHLVHRNSGNHDGAIVVNPTTDPKFVLFHFENQTF